MYIVILFYYSFDVSYKFLNIDVVGFRINKTDFLMQLILVYFLTFFSIPSCKRVIN